MKTLPSGLAASVASGVTTLCTCFRVTRRDGAVFGFTDHDRALAFEGVDFEPGTGFTGSDVSASIGLAVDTMEVDGALSSDAITEDDLAAKRWDGAAVTVWRVDWSDVSDRVVVLSGTLGEIERGPVAHHTELRSLAHALNQPTGRIYGATCDADLGDSRCGVDLGAPAYSDTGSVASSSSRNAFTTAGLGSFAADWCRRGKLTWTSGANEGLIVEVKRHLTLSGARAIELSEEMPFDIEAGDGFAIEAGCDKTIATCAAKFDNVVNFRGYPHMPGNDWIMSYPNRDDGNDGGSRLRDGGLFAT
ncbi:DUF2163 domain-containing protein [Mesorhizobium australicum]|uniref:Bacteriophage phiJL001 Gp84 C-terminal domain-containing protein n=1 Tax=Mesorhizobium australicum TaxID=536018 RepID=A0A1X7NWC3_9HYPH|nr:DUF2163 domain-containing protein [Mesorhizobium australicum]SMH42538.1 phage conserved hypothetical protein BR0599 [Mesorhizobium australicum]